MTNGQCATSTGNLTCWSHNRNTSVLTEEGGMLSVACCLVYFTTFSLFLFCRPINYFQSCKTLPVVCFLISCNLAFPFRFGVNPLRFWSWSLLLIVVKEMNTSWRAFLTRCSVIKRSVKCFPPFLTIESASSSLTRLAHSRNGCAQKNKKMANSRSGTFKNLDRFKALISSSAEWPTRYKRTTPVQFEWELFITSELLHCASLTIHNCNKII